MKEIADVVARLRGLQFTRPVEVDFLSKRAFDKLLSPVSGGARAPSANRPTRELRALGIIPRHASTSTSRSALAFYNPRTKRISVRGHTFDVFARVILAHELTHALQDQHFGLRRLQVRAFKDHASEPLRAVIEGDATFVQDAFVKQLGQADQDAYGEARRTSTARARDEVSTHGIPDALVAQTQSAYTLGWQMVAFVAATKGPSGVNQLFRHPPTTDTAYLAPSTLRGRPREGISVPDPKLQHGEVADGPPDVFGAFDLYLLLAGYIDPVDALAAASGWGGDRRQAFRRGATECVRVAIAGRTRAATNSIAASLDDWVAASPGAKASVDKRPGLVTVTSCTSKVKRHQRRRAYTTAVVIAEEHNRALVDAVKAGATPQAASCGADQVARDPAFQAVLDNVLAIRKQSQAAVESLRTRTSELAAACAAGST